MSHRFVAVMLILSWTIVLAQHGVASDGGERTTYLSQAAAHEDLWVQPSGGSRELVRPPERSLWQPLLPAAIAVLDSSVADPSPRSDGANLGGRASLPSRRILHHRSTSSREDGQSA